MDQGRAGFTAYVHARTQTVVADGVGGRCLVWAAAALDGPGRSGRGPSWPLLLVSGAGVLALLGLRRRLRR